MRLTAPPTARPIEASPAIEEKSAWAVYRQALRDVPQQTEFPASVTWPVLS